VKKDISVSYWYERAKSYSVEVKCWQLGDKWMWNVYAHVFDNHRKFDDNDWLMSLSMHGGVTFDKQTISQPLGGCRYDWMTTKKTKAIGCDFEHIYDDHDNHPSPIDYGLGEIPQPFLAVAKEISEQLKEKQNDK
jgi:hypothetical protein